MSLLRYSHHQIESETEKTRKLEQIKIYLSKLVTATTAATSTTTAPTTTATATARCAVTSSNNNHNNNNNNLQSESKLKKKRSFKEISISNIIPEINVTTTFDIETVSPDNENDSDDDDDDDNDNDNDDTTEDMKEMDAMDDFDLDQAFHCPQNLSYGFYSKLYPTTKQQECGQNSYDMDDYLPLAYEGQGDIEVDGEVESENFKVPPLPLFIPLANSKLKIVTK